MKTKMVLVLWLLMLNGCGLLRVTVVPREQINADIADKTIKARNPNSLERQTEWSFKEDSFRCFAPSGDETKVTESTADISINLSSMKLLSSGNTPILFGKILLHYKKDNDKWKLESIEPKDVITNDLTSEAFSKYVNLQQPLCNYFKYDPKQIQ